MARSYSLRRCGDGRTRGRRVDAAPRNILARAVLAVALVVTSATSTAAMTACRGGDDTAANAGVPDVRLGMSPRDVRDRFAPGTDGSWQTQIAKNPGEDTVLAWKAHHAASAPISEARFEFHLGMLVAVRAHLRTSQASSRAATTVTPKTVTVRAPHDEGGTTLTILARDCPTHHEEAEAAVSRAR